MLDLCFNGIALKEAEQSTPKNMGVWLKPARLLITTMIRMSSNAFLDWDQNPVESTPHS